MNLCIKVYYIEFPIRIRGLPSKMRDFCSPRALEIAKVLHLLAWFRSTSSRSLRNTFPFGCRPHEGTNSQDNIINAPIGLYLIPYLIEYVIL